MALVNLLGIVVIIEVIIVAIIVVILEVTVEVILEVGMKINTNTAIITQMLLCVVIVTGVDMLQEIVALFDVSLCKCLL